MPIATPDDASNTPKMHAYARGSGPEAVSNGAPVSNAKGLSRADTPQVFSSTARQAIGDGARLTMPAPKPTRFNALNHHTRSQSGAPSQSPPHAPGTASPMRRARTNSNDRAAGGASAALWAPSVLSDSEFNSPPSDPEASRMGRFQSLNNDAHPAMTQPPPSWNQHQGQHQSAHFSEFTIGNDGMMQVRPAPNGNRNHQHHHTQDDHRENRQSLEDPFEPRSAYQAKLPMRSTPPRKSYPEHSNYPVNNLVDEDERRGAIPPTFKSARAPERVKHEPSSRQNPIFGADEDEDYSDMPSEPEQATPRGPDRRTTKTFLESPLPYPSPTKEDRGRKRRWQTCDYDDKALSSMNYADLQGQPFDADPSAGASPSAGSAPEGNSLAARLDHHKAKGEADQRAFFGAMPVAEWDGAGDWFLEQFGAMMQQMREGRRRRREVVARFEGEIAEREEGVRVRAEGVRGKLDRMKRDGLRVVADE